MNASSSYDITDFKKSRLSLKVMLQQKIDQQMKKISEMKNWVNQLLEQVNILKQ